MKTIILPISHSISHSPLRCVLILIPLVLMCAALLPEARAVTPAPDGGYPGFNTAEGDGALQSLTSGTSNTAIGFDALFSTTTGSNNTAAGIGALGSTTTGSDNTAVSFEDVNNVTTAGNVICVESGVVGANVSNSCYIGSVLKSRSGQWHNPAKYFSRLNRSSSVTRKKYSRKRFRSLAWW